MFWDTGTTWVLSEPRAEFRRALRGWTRSAEI
jgi:hypothetical protein